MRRLLILTGCFLLAAVAAPAQQPDDPVDRELTEELSPRERMAQARETRDRFLKDWSVRVRLTTGTPAIPVDIEWRHGGEGLGGDVKRGLFCRQLPPAEWSAPKTFGELIDRVPRGLTLTFVAYADYDKRSGRNAAPPIQSCTMEFEFRHQDEVLRRIVVLAPDGATASVMIFGDILTGEAKPTAAIAAQGILSLLERARWRAALLEGLPWKDGPFPKKYMIVTDLSGHGVGSGRGIRTCDKAVIEVECRVLRLLGVNALRGAPEFLQKEIDENRGLGVAFARREISHAASLGYPVPSTRRVQRTREILRTPDGAGCAFDPGVAEGTLTNLARAAELLTRPMDEVWAITVDEIGSVMNRAPNGKNHLLDCEHCRAGYREYVRGEGYTLADFGKQSWDEVVPVNFWGDGKPATRDDPRAPWRTGDAGTSLGAYCTMRFVNDASAGLFTAQRDFFVKANAAKRAALAAGETDSPAARQPWIYNYAMRGCTFLRMGGLDFFDFYRLADNAFVYETSNRDPRLWHWDSYLNDVGRVVCAREGLQFGILIKPHRGAPIQRLLSAAGRGVRLIFWYTYGPDYKKGDSFSQAPLAMEKASFAAHLLGKTEDVLYDATWKTKPEVALLRTRQSPVEHPVTAIAVNEDAKWTFTALTHAHVPIDPLDETTVEETDLSRYKVIYAVGSTLTRAAAEKLAAWVKAGGTLYTSAAGLLYDERHRPLESLRDVLGLKERTPPEIWGPIGVAGAAALAPFEVATTNVLPSQTLAASSIVTNALPLAVGREVLVPQPGTETLVTFGDGKAAMTRHSYGKGKVYVFGVFGGVEYAVPTMHAEFDMTRDFDAHRRSYVTMTALELGKPAVQVSVPTVEAVWLQNPVTGKQAVTVINWAYRRLPPNANANRPGSSNELILVNDLSLTIRGAGPVTKVVSAATGRALAMSTSDDAIQVTLPRLAEGDVLLLE